MYRFSDIIIIIRVKYSRIAIAIEYVIIAETTFFSLWSNRFITLDEDISIVLQISMSKSAIISHCTVVSNNILPCSIALIAIYRIAFKDIASVVVIE